MISQLFIYHRGEINNTARKRSWNRTDNKMNDLICYCFEYTREDIEKDLRKNGRSLIMEKIQAEKKFGNCRCIDKNPKGR
jgi:hypothetical protein